MQATDFLDAPDAPTPAAAQPPAPRATDFLDAPEPKPTATAPSAETFLDAPDDQDSFGDKVKGAAIRFGVGTAEGMQRVAGNIGQGVAQLSDPGPLKQDFATFQRAQDAALKDVNGPQFDPVSNTSTDPNSFGRAMGNLVNQRELQRQALRAPGESFSDAARELAGELKWAGDVTPGPKLASTAGNTFGQTAAMLAPAAIPVVGPVTGAVTAGAASTGGTFDQAFQAYKEAGFPPDAAREKARDIALKTGGTTALIFSLPVGELAAMPKSTVARLAAVAGIGGGQMGADTLQSLLQAKGSYNPNLTLTDIAKQTGTSAGFGALLSGAMHGAGELGKTGEQVPANGEQPAPISEQPAAKPTPAPADTSPDALKALQATLAANQVKPTVRMPGQALLNEMRQQQAQPETGTIVPESPPEASPGGDQPKPPVPQYLLDQGQKTGAGGVVWDEASRMWKLVAGTKETTPLTEPTEGETKGVAAPETITGGTDLNVTHEQTGSPSTASSGAIPAEEGSGPSRSAAVSSKKSRADLQRPWDLIDEVQGQIGTIDPKLIKEANPDWKPTGAARKIFKTGGRPADTVADHLSQSGMYKGDPGQVDQLGDALNAAAEARKGWRTKFYSDERALDTQGKQLSAFQRDAKRPGPNQEDLVSDTLNEGDQFTLRGAKVTVKKMQFDDEGRVQSVELDDGKKYGTQHVGSETVLQIDKDSFEPIKEGAPKKPVDPVVDYLNSLKIDLKDKLHAFGLAPAMWNSLVDGVILGVRGGRKIGEAIDWAIQQFKAKFPGQQFDEAGARSHFEKTPAGNLRYESPDGAAVAPHDQLKGRRAEIDKRLAEIGAETGKAQKKFTNLPPDLRSERYELTKERSGVTKQLLENPDYVRELLLSQESKGAEYQAAKAAGDTKRVKELVDDLMPGSATDPKTELDRVAPELLDKVRKQLETEGKLKPLPQGAPAGRTLGELTAWLKQNKIDSPKLTLRERLNLGKRLADTYEKGAGLASKAFNETMAAWEAFKAQYKSPPVDDDVRGVRKDWLNEKQWTGLETQRWLDEVDRAVPRPDRQQALSIYLDAGRDENLLRAQLDEVPEKWKKVWKSALSLTPTEKDLAARLALEFNTKLSDGQLLGLIDRGREDYGVPQLWNKDKMPKWETPYDPADPQYKKQGPPRNLRTTLDSRDPFFALKRKVPSYFDGIMAGGEPLSLKVRDLVGVYNAQFNEALTDRGYVWDLRKAKAEDGQPAVYLSGGVKTEPTGDGGRQIFVDSSWRNKDAVTKDGRPYMSLDHPALKGWKFGSVDAEGNPIMVHGDFMVHPDQFNNIARDLDQSMLREPRYVGDGYAKLFNGLLQSTAFMKASKFAAATFHGMTLAEHLMTHAFAGKPTAERLSLLSPSTRGVEIDPAKNPDLALLMRNGTQMGFDGQRNLFEEGVASHGGILEHVPIVGDALKATTDFVFQKYLPGLKAKLGGVLLNSNRARYSSKLSDDQIAELTSNQLNAAFGGQNWRLMGKSKTMLDVNRLLFTAPDFLLSRAKVVGQALKPYGREQRFFLAAQAALVYTGARVLNSLFSKDHNPHWEPGMWDKVAIGNRAYSARFLVSDLASAGTHPVEFAAGRISPWPKTLIDAFVQRDWRTGAKIDVPFKTDNNALRAVEIMGKDIGSWFVPMGAEGFLPGAPVKEQSKASQVAQAVAGVGSRKYTPETQMFDAASSFNSSSPDRKTQLFEQERNERAQSQSVYRKLTDLLEANRLDDARQEYQSLLADGRTPATIATHFQGIYRPFTGNQQREKAFKNSLSPADLSTYNQAIQERKDRRDKFKQIPTQPTTASAQ